MLSFETTCAFFVASLLMAMTPGPDVIIVLTQSSLYGMRAGVLTTLGLMTGLLGHTLAVALGVAVLAPRCRGRYKSRSAPGCCGRFGCQAHVCHCGASLCGGRWTLKACLARAGRRCCLS